MGLEIKDEVQTTTTQENQSGEATTSLTDNSGQAEAQTVTPQSETNVSEGSNVEDSNDETNKEPEVKESDTFDYSKYEQEFLSTGDISTESKEELYKLFPRNLVDNYIANLKQATAYAIAENEKKAFNLVGGEDNYKSLMSWASANLDADEKEAFNEAVSGSNEKLALQAIKGLKARMDLSLATNKGPNVVLGSNDVAGVSNDVFLSRQDYANALAKPEYQTSPQYRAEVDAKLARTLKTGGYKA